MLRTLKMAHLCNGALGCPVAFSPYRPAILTAQITLCNNPRYGFNEIRNLAVQTNRHCRLTVIQSSQALVRLRLQKRRRAIMMNSEVPNPSTVNEPCAATCSDSRCALVSCITTEDILTSITMAAICPGIPNSTHAAKTGASDTRTITPFFRHPNLKNTLQRRNICAKPAIIKQATACAWSPGQHRSTCLGAARRLAAVVLHPLAHVASSLGYELNCFTQKPDDQSRQTHTLQTMLPEFPQEVLLEVAPATKECKIGFSFLMVLVLKSGKLDSAHKVGNLGKSVEIWARFAIHQSLLREHIPKSAVQDPRYHALTVVVIDLHRFEPLKTLQLLKKEIGNISLHFLLERGATRKLAFAIHEYRVAEGNMPDKRGEAEQIASPLLNTLIREAAVPMRQRYKMELPALQAPVTEQLLVSDHFPRDIIRLIVKNKGQDVVLGVRAEIAGLINKNGKLAHLGCLQKQESRGDPPALDGSPCVETHLLYTTRRFGYSIVSNSEHMFFIIDTNTRSPYRKAA